MSSRLANSLPFAKLALASFLLLQMASSRALAQAAPLSPVLGAMKTELIRSLDTLGRQPTPPYFISYEITDDKSITVTGSFGKITSSAEDHQRQLDIDLRVGDDRLDNTHAMTDEPIDFTAILQKSTNVPIPIEDDALPIRNAIWYNTDQKYKAAVERLTKVKTDVQLKAPAEDQSADFSAEPAHKYSEPIMPMGVLRSAWEEKVRTYTAPFSKERDIYEANAEFVADIETRWYVNSDGSEIQISRPYYRLFISAQIRADDGMSLPLYESYFGVRPEDLPDDATVLKAIGGMISDLKALRAAPVVDPYTGPAILSGRASAVFFHEVFGHRIEGHRQKEEQEGQTFKNKVGQAVLPKNFSVYSDPTLNRIGDVDLVGSYPFDNEGVAAQRVTVVDHGIFENFLMGRSPIQGFSHSNGHGRKQQGFAPVARQSNLIVDVENPVSRAQLKQMLIDEIKKQNSPFGLYFDEIEGGFTLTGRDLPNAFNVLPTKVYRIYPDGKEELVRGVDLIGTPLTTFSKLVAADNEVAVFNGLCGAESRLIPVSASSPAVLVSQIEVQKKAKSGESAPVLPAPF